MAYLSAESNSVGSQLDGVAALHGLLFAWDADNHSLLANGNAGIMVAADS